MSTQTSLARLRKGPDDGFSLLEVIVALSIFAVVAFAALPLVLTGLKASAKARIETLAKDLSQLRVERLRNLAFHVDRQNGPYVDLLDRYFTNRTGADSPTGETGCTGRYLAAADPGIKGAPAGASYRVTCATLPEATGFSQKVYSQFLARTASPVATPAGYDSQTVGADAAPTQLLGVTVLTSWVKGGRNGTLRTYTEIADGRSNGALITTQAQALALRVASNDASLGTNLVAVAGQVKADGSLTTGSIASVQTVGASLEQSGLATLSSAVTNAVSPTSGTPAGSTGSTSGTALPNSGSPTTPWESCGWGWFGNNAYSNASSTIAAGVPVTPSNTGNDATVTGTPRTEAGLLRNGSSCAGYAFGFRNWLSAPSYAPALGLSRVRPLVYLPDATGGGGVANGLAVGRASISATDLTTLPNHASAVATANTEIVSLLPTNDRPGGLVSVKLNSSRIACKSTQPVTSSYSVTVWWPGGPALGTTYSYTTGGAVPSLPNPQGILFVEGGVTHALSEYLSWDLSTGVEEEASGARSIDHVFGVSVPASVAGNGGFGVQLGSLSCAAADVR